MNSSKKDILILCQFFYPEYITSATLPTDLAVDLVKNGLEVDVITGYPSEYLNSNVIDKKENYKGVNIKRVKYLSLNRKNILGRAINFTTFYISVFLRLLNFKNYKAIIVYSNPPILPQLAVIAKKLFNTKIVYVSFDIYPEIAIKSGKISERGMIAKFMRHMNKILEKNVDRIVTLSNDMTNFYEIQRKIDPTKLVMIPNWEEDKVLSTKTINDSNIKSIFESGRFVVSYLGNMGVCQDIKTISDTMVKMKDSNVFFFFSGHGVKKESLMELIEKENITNAYVHDYLHGKDFEYVLNKSDAFIVSLVSEVTGLAVPSKTYTYYMASKPVISIMSKETDIAKEIENYQLGYAIENNDVNGLVEILEKISEDYQLCKKMKKNSNVLFKKKYTRQVNTSKYNEMMKEVLKNGN